MSDHHKHPRPHAWRIPAAAAVVAAVALSSASVADALAPRDRAPMRLQVLGARELSDVYACVATPVEERPAPIVLYITNRRATSRARRAIRQARASDRAVVRYTIPGQRQPLRIRLAERLEREAGERFGDDQALSITPLRLPENMATCPKVTLALHRDAPEAQIRWAHQQQRRYSPARIEVFDPDDPPVQIPLAG